MVNIGYRMLGTEDLNKSSAKGRTFKKGRKLLDAANAKTIIIPSKNMESKAKFTEKRRNNIFSLYNLNF